MERKQDASVKRVEDGAYSSRGNTLNSDNCPEVTIGLSLEGNYTHANIKADSKEHIQGKNYPMYGLTTLDNPDGVNKSDNPKVRMKHLSALVAIKVVNQGDASKNDLTANKDGNEKQITINEITFSVPKINTVDANKKTVKQSALPIVGAFNVDITGEVSAASFSPVSGKTSNSVTLSLQQSVPIDPGKDTTFYLAVRPFDATNNKTELSFTNKSAITLDITINGSKRSVEVPADTKFEAGKVTTLRVPVKLSYPKESNAVKGTPTFVTMVSNTTNPNLIYNGETVSAYIVGTSGANDGKLGGQGKIKISGSTTELLNALDAGFYASTWKGMPAAMTVTNLMLYFRDSAGDYTVPFIKHDPFLYAIGVELQDELLGLPAEYSGPLIQLVLDILDLDNGIPRQGGMINLTKFIHPSTITFNGIISNNVESASDPILILDEEPIFKELGSAAINNLLKEKFTYNGKVPTAQGLKDIVNKTEGSSDANDTAEAIYYSLKDVLGTSGDISTKVKLFNFIPITVDMNLGIVFDELIAQYNDTDPIEGLKEVLRDMKFEIEIGSYPYAANKLTAYGTKGEPVVPKEYGCNPIVFWGLSKGLVLN